MPSTIAGYLTPAPTPAPLQDDALDDFLGDVVAGVTGLDRDHAVRPRWQLDPPNIPDRTITWASVGVVAFEPDTNAYVGLEPDGLSQNIVRHETIVVVVSFYGPACGEYAGYFRDGLLIPQNNEALMSAGFGFLETTGPTAAPELIKERWLQRSDIIWRTRREVRRVYPILSLLSAHGTINTDHDSYAFDVTPPP